MGTMTSKERVQAVLQGNIPDRVPTRTFGIDPIFVKNLETVQGDERDIIIISIGYGKDERGRFIQNFGPITKFGGERRFNVLISRAREKIYVVTSVHPRDYPKGSKNRNFELVRKYLLFAETKDEKLAF